MAAPILLIPNDHLLVWLPSTETPGPRLLRRIRAGEWSLPAEIAEHFEVPEGLVLHAHLHGGTLVIRPDPPLREKVPGQRIDLSPDQMRVLRLLAAGLTSRQIAAALHRRQRWVFYRIAEIRRAFGAYNRAELLRKKKGDE